MPDRESYLRQVERVASSRVLHGSESLCKLLRYLAHHAIEHPGVPLKEYQIATEQFGRSQDFDPAIDSMVRVQAGRLRSKLIEYYAEEGADDSLRIDLPKGTYSLAFHKHNSHKSLASDRDRVANQPPDSSALNPPSALPTQRGFLIALITLSVLLAASLLALLLPRASVSSALSVPEKAPAAAVRNFWGPFLKGPDEPWVVFSNAAFFGRPETGMRYFNPAQDRPDSIWDHYTGVGEVLSVHTLDQLFGSLHHTLRVKRGSLFSLDDAKNSDLIFVGSPSENLTLLEIPGTREFVFQRVPDGPRKGDLSIRNLHPEPGEQPAYLASPSNVPLAEDYAIVAFLPGLNPSRSEMIVAGTTTFGTQGAVEYVSRPNSLQELLLRLPVSDNGTPSHFEALLHVKIAKGVPVETSLVSLRREPNPSSP